MILSVTGVLAAGTAAALVNTEVLREDAGPQVTAPVATTAPSLAPAGSTTPATAPATSSASLPATVATVAADTVVTQVSVPITPVGGPPSTPATDPAGSSPPVSGPTTQQQFRLGDAATAILDTANGLLTIVSVAPHPGWVVDRAEQDDPTTVEIRLRSANGEVRFEASLVRGVVAVSLGTDDDVDDSGSSGSDSSGSGSGSGSDSSGSGSGSSGSGGGDDD